MINIIDYTNLCSSALLDSIDNIYDHFKEELIIDLSSKKHKEIFNFYLYSQLKAKRQFGMFNVVINSCHPNDNWRNIEKTINNKYNILDTSIIVDVTLMETFYNKCYKEIQKEDFIFIQHNETDLTDVITCIDRIIGSQYLLNRNIFYIINDNNNMFCHDEYIEKYIHQEIENILKDNGLI